MTLRGLNRISPILRERLLSKRNHTLYFEEVFLNQIIVPDETHYVFPSNNRNLPRTDQILTLTNDLDIVGSADGYDGNVRRGTYANQWDKRGIEVNVANPWGQINNPSADILRLWNDEVRNRFNNYIDYTDHVFGRNRSFVNVLGGIVSGRNPGISLGSDGVRVVSNFNINQTIAGRIFGTASGEETPLGRFGLKAAAISIANNILARTQRNLLFGNPSFLTRRFKFWDPTFRDGFSENSITVEPDNLFNSILNQTGLGDIVSVVASNSPIFGGLLDRLFDNATTENDGRYILIDKNASIFDIDHMEGLVPIPDLHLFLGDFNGLMRNTRRDRNQTLIEWTGRITAASIFEHLTRNKYGPAYEIPQRFQNGRSSFNVSADYLEALQGYVGDDINHPMPSGIRSFENLAGKSENTQTHGDGYNWAGAWQEGVDNTFQNRGINTAHNEFNFIGFNDKIYYGITDEQFGNEPPNSLLKKTKDLFDHNKIQTIVSAFGKREEKGSSTQSATHFNWGMSKGRNLLKRSYWEGGERVDVSHGYDNPYCRVWTYHRQYRKLENLIRPFMDHEERQIGSNPMKLEDLHSKVDFIRPYLANFANHTVLQNNGFPKIVPYKSDWQGFNAENVKRYMFSIENLAWKDILLEDFLCPSQVGSNGGRLMYFAPYNLKFTEAANVQLNQEDFIGRGEPVYTYVNTQRTGTLSFSMVVDHSSFLNYMDRTPGGGRESEDIEQELLRFIAGCDIPDTFQDVNNRTGQVETEDNPVPIERPTAVVEDPYIAEEPEVDPPPPVPGDRYILTQIYFPNDFSGVDFNNGLTSLRYLREGNGRNLSGGQGYECSGGISLGNVVDGVMRQVGGSQYISGVRCGNPVGRENGRVGGTTSGAIVRKPTLGDATSYTIGNIAMGNNTHITDSIIGGGYDTRIGNRQSDFLPRHQYVAWFSYWDIENHGLNARVPHNKKGNGMSFEKLFDLCTTPHPTADQTEELYELYSILKTAHSIIIGGVANHDNVGDADRLARNRGITVKDFLRRVVFNRTITYRDNSISLNNEDFKRVIYESKPAVGPANTNPICASGEYSKQNRRVDIEIVLPRYQVQNIEDVTPQGDDYITSNTVRVDTREREFDVNNVTYRINKDEYRGRLRYDEERAFFKEIESGNDLLLTKLREKLDFFIPAFHSTTPEGFNARLAFLHQCTRQGPTVSATDRNMKTATNLSFGRPPVCVLRVGDFYHSRIMIESLNIDFEDGGAVRWDLNPEGIGIQPVIANITMAFKFLGGQDLSGAILRLQNAVSFNFYCNQSVYDDRSDLIINRTQRTTRRYDSSGEFDRNVDVVTDNMLELFDPFNPLHRNAGDYSVGNVNNDRRNSAPPPTIDINDGRFDALNNVGRVMLDRSSDFTPAL